MDDVVVTVIVFVNVVSFAKVVAGLSFFLLLLFLQFLRLLHFLNCCNCISIYVVATIVRVAVNFAIVTDVTK